MELGANLEDARTRATEAREEERAREEGGHALLTLRFPDGSTGQVTQ